jgi:hypothetical protein
MKTPRGVKGTMIKHATLVAGNEQASRPHKFQRLTAGQIMARDSERPREPISRHIVGVLALLRQRSEFNLA